MKMNWGKMMMMIILMRKRIIECALSYPEVDPPITTFLIFVPHELSATQTLLRTLCSKLQKLHSIFFYKFTTVKDVNCAQISNMYR